MAAPRPRKRARISRGMYNRAIERLREDLDDGVRAATALGLDVSEIPLPL